MATEPVPVQCYLGLQRLGWLPFPCHVLASALSELSYEKSLNYSFQAVHCIGAWFELFSMKCTLELGMFDKVACVELFVLSCMIAY